jgi:uncharacterized membrane protein YdbT with pleckstrin-like domain
MAVQLNEIINLLGREYLFQDMSQEQLAWVASQFQVRTLDRNTVVYSQGSPGDFFYMIFHGKVRVIQRVHGEDRPLNVMGQGEFFGEGALLYNRPRSLTISTVETTTLLRIDQERFNWMLQAYPAIRSRLSATAESRRMARTLHFGWLGGDEEIYFISRKHEFFLLIALIPSIILGVAAFPILAFGLAQVSINSFFTLLVFIGALMIVAALAWGIWSWVDWGNDYYIVTSQRVIWLEKVIGLYDSRREAPLETILAVNVISSQLGRIFHYGNVSVRTFTGGILMRNANNPNMFASFVEGFKKRAISISKEEEATTMQQALEKALTHSYLVDNEPAQVPVEPPPYPPPKQKEVKPEPTLRERLDNLLKVRYEQDGVITYRKHWFILFTKAWLPAVLTAGILAGTLFMVGARLLGNQTVPPVVFVCGVGILLFLAAFVWLVYDYLDWSNDIYRLTADQIHDIERKPLGQEVKKTAPLESILSIEHERANILGILLNFGNVTVNVGQTNFIFYGVYNPDQVHQDISDYREALNRRKREKEAKLERDRMVNWLVTYHNEADNFGEVEE